MQQRIDNSKAMNYLILYMVLFIFLNCKNTGDQQLIGRYQEKELSFAQINYGYDTSSTWIKQPENILMLHETFKKIGYNNLVTEKDLTSDWNWFVDVSRSPGDLLDSLEVTYQNYLEAPTYYREFWQRRVSEANNEEVYKVIKEVKQILLQAEDLSYEKKVVNDTLYQLLSYHYPWRRLTNYECNLLLDYLIDIGLHQSAYNLVSGENGKFSEVEWDDTTRVMQVLRPADFNRWVWYEDNTK